MTKHRTRLTCRKLTKVKVPKISIEIFERGSTMVYTWQDRETRWHDDYEKKFWEFKLQLVKLKADNQKIDGSLNYHSRPSFSRWIIEEIILPHFKMPQLESYEGSSNPLDSYKAYMMIQCASDALYYLSFSMTLKKPTRVWYSSLKLESINSFSQLEELFMTHFRTS